RHQKVIEEAPSPLADRLPGLRERLAEAALAATRAVEYVGAGTVEFVADQDGGFYFLEMNTRLQVEHPVTECTTGLDLVRLQLQIAAGTKLVGRPPASTGHAIEARLYAEDPSRDWQPASGPLHRFEIGQQPARFSVPVGGGLRLDAAVTDGSMVGVHYDPMLAKLICAGTDRAAVARQLAAALAGSRIHGLITNRDLLVRVLRHPAFLAGELDTGFLERPGLTEPLANPAAERLSALAAALADAAANRAAAPVLAGLPSGWRNVASQPQRASYQGSSGRHDIDYRWQRAAVQLSGFDDVEVLAASPERVLLAIGGVRRAFAVARYRQLVCIDSALGPVSLTPVPRFTDPADAVAAGSLIAPMPGAVIRLGPPVGSLVAAGQPLLWIEAMKMEHPILAPAAGVLSQLPVGVGDQVAIGDVLAIVEPEPEPGPEPELKRAQ
ncbi:MAG: biotin/lipoyl-containing protein, partial [Jatrophihabitantaceae bacterium]